MHRSAPTDRLNILSRRFLLICSAFLLLSAGFSPQKLFAFQQDAEPVRVRLLRDVSPRTIIVSSNKTVDLYSGGDISNPIAQLNNRQKLTLTTSNNQVYLRIAESGIYARSLIIVQPPDAELTIELAEAQAIVSPRTYKGSFKIQVDPATPSTLSIINEVPLDDYVESVLASEFNFNELEASKALAVCIRTLAYRGLENQYIPEFAIPDNELWQVYKGTAPITNTVREAVKQTQGEALRYDNNLIEAVYFASSGGRTANNEDVWNASKIQPYLRGKDDPYDYNSPNHTWESNIPRDRMLRMLSDKYRFNANGIKILERSRDGRVKTMAVTDGNGREEHVPGNDFRLLVNEQFGRETLKSTFYEINVQPTMYIFAGKGAGHGVGLNQWGALQLSKKGNTYEEILAYYYNDVQIDKGGLVNRMLTATNDFVDNTTPYFSSNNEAYNPIIEASSASDNTQLTYPQPVTDDLSARLLGEEDAEEPEESRRPFWRRKDNTDQPAAQATKNTTRPQPTGKRIGW